MKNIIYILLIFSLFSACKDFTDIKPKGQSMLETVSELEMLLNYPYSGVGFINSDLQYFVNDYMPEVDIPQLITLDKNDYNKALYLWDETIDRANLRETDSRYTTFYRIIGRIANPILSNIDDAEGDEELAQQIKAEAYVLRAYFHYILVNIYAKAYDPETAETDGGIPYSKETDAFSVENKKYTVKEVYDFILEDLDAAFELNSLPDKPSNNMRVGKAFAYAVLAKVNMSLRKYNEANEAATQSLGYNNVIFDHHLLQPLMVYSRPRLHEEDIFYTETQIMARIFTPEMKNSFEEESLFYNNILINQEAFIIFTDQSQYVGIPNTYWIYDLSNFSGSGLTTIDMYLTQAECKIRSGDISGAVSIINDIRKYRVSPYEELRASTPQEAFKILKNISRTENSLSYKNFVNLKRWNTEEAYKETLYKTISYESNGINHSYDFKLEPDSPLWIFPFPQDATLYNSNLTQNYEFIVDNEQEEIE